MSIVCAVNVELIWLRKLLWITISRTQAKDDLLTFHNLLISQCEIFLCLSHSLLRRAIVAQYFVDGSRKESRIMLHFLHLLRMLEQDIEAVCNQVCCCHIAS